MEDLFKAVAEAPVANLFIIGGLLFIAIAVLGKVSGKIEPGRGGRVWSAIVGTLFLVGGLTLHFLPMILAARTTTPQVAGLATDTPVLSSETTAPLREATTALPTATLPSASATQASPASMNVAPTQAPTRTAAPTTAAPTLAPTQPPAATSSAGSWVKLPDLPRQIKGWAVDPINPQVIYAGTGDSGSGSGVFRSDDAGLTWSRVSNGLPDEDVKAVALACAEKCNLLAAVSGKVYASADGGTKWSSLGSMGIFGGFYFQFWVHPTNAGTVYAVVQPRGPLRSTDGGSTWSLLSGGLPGKDEEVYVLSLACDPGAPNVLYAGTGGWVGHGQGVWKSVDGGDSWTASNRGMLDYRISALAVDPLDSQRVYAGADSGELFISDDAGQSWREVSNTLPKAGSSHPDVRGILIDPANPQSVYLLANYRGVVHSADWGVTWRLLGAPGEDNQTAYTRMAVIHGGQPVILVGAEREGAWRYAGDEH